MLNKFKVQQTIADRAVSMLSKVLGYALTMITKMLGRKRMNPVE
jgi:hypothetical protein